MKKLLLSDMKEMKDVAGDRKESIEALKSRMTEFEPKI